MFKHNKIMGVLRAFQNRNKDNGHLPDTQDAQTGQDATAPLVRLKVMADWIDYNGHMTESRYLFAASETSDALLRLVGADLDYVAGGHSYYSAETHIIHLGEAKLGDDLSGSAQVLGADEKRLHLFITIAKDGAPMATLEQMLLHVDMAAGKACPAPADILARVMQIRDAHAQLARPDSAGRYIGKARR